MMNRFRNFMAGRYGVNDQLNIALLIFGCILTFIFSIIGVKYIHMLSWIPFIVVVWRMFSRNIAKRQAENQKFLKNTEPCRKFFNKKTAQWQDSEHKYYNCPGCKRTLRVPKNRGKIKITCPHCNREFTKRT